MKGGYLRLFTTLYSTSARRRVALQNSQSIGRSASLPGAVSRAMWRIERGEYARADVYDQYGTWVRSIVKHTKIGVAIRVDVERLSMHTLDATTERHSKAFNEFLHAPRTSSFH